VALEELVDRYLILIGLTIDQNLNQEGYKLKGIFITKISSMPGFLREKDSQ